MSPWPLGRSGLVRGGEEDGWTAQIDFTGDGGIRREDRYLDPDSDCRLGSGLSVCGRFGRPRGGTGPVVDRNSAPRFCGEFDVDSGIDILRARCDGASGALWSIPVDRTARGDSRREVDAESSIESGSVARQVAHRLRRRPLDHDLAARQGGLPSRARGSTVRDRSQLRPAGLDRPRGASRGAGAGVPQLPRDSACEIRFAGHLLTRSGGSPPCSIFPVERIFLAHSVRLPNRGAGSLGERGVRRRWRRTGGRSRGARPQSTG